jgi:plasmid stabilization system protein ParE
MKIAWLPTAMRDLQRLREFLRPRNPEAARKAVEIIRRVVSVLESQPHLGKGVEDLPHFHDVVIPFGARNYILRYRVQGETVFILALRHAREAGFSDD